MLFFLWLALLVEVQIEVTFRNICHIRCGGDVDAREHMQTMSGWNIAFKDGNYN